MQTQWYSIERALSKNDQLQEFTDKELSDISAVIKKGNEAEKKISDYVDSLMTAINPSPPSEDNWAKPVIHPCKRKLSQIPDSQLEQDYIDLVNMVQSHTHCSYCL